MEARLQHALDRRQSEGTLRSLQSINELQQQEESSFFIDFSSNDYLGLARCRQQQASVNTAYSDACSTTSANNNLGATGSRLLSGDSVYCRQLEEWLAGLHKRPTALVCNSGYDANLCITSCLPVNVVIMDELCHNSINMGVRWNSRQQKTVVAIFQHNDVKDLERKLQEHTNADSVILVIVESVYSMDGDVAPLQDILNVSNKFGAQVVVDEAHGLGIYGRTNRRDLRLNHHDNKKGVGGTGVLAALELESHPALLASVYTFGKAAGCHGAVICCSSPLLKDYLLNYARPFIYSTALPSHSLVTIKCSYETMIGTNGEERRLKVFALVNIFRKLVENMLRDGTGSSYCTNNSIRLCPSDSPIQALLVPGNDACIEFCRIMQQRFGILLYPIRAPTVARGQERVRIILHAHNTPPQVTHLVECMGKTLQQIRTRNNITKSRL